MATCFSEEIGREFCNAAIVKALEEAPYKKLTVRELRQKAQFARGITDHISEMHSKGLLLILTKGEINMETEVSLSR